MSDNLHKTLHVKSLSFSNSVIVPHLTEGTSFDKSPIVRPKITLVNKQKAVGIRSKYASPRTNEPSVEGRVNLSC